jgi:glycosyltransferase involved in cell wall biosynthesis
MSNATDKTLSADARGQEKLISIVSPVYNEEKVVSIFLKEISSLFEKTDYAYELVIVNDGSRDNTFSKLLELKENYENLRVINLSRNFGKEAALSAGIDAAKGDAVIPIDCDLQDPPELILDMLSHWEEGYEVVLAKRVDRSSDSALKRYTAYGFYHVHNMISHVGIPENVGDFRLMSRKVVDALKQLPETQRFMKGIFAWVGFKSITIEYVRPPRCAGDTSFNSWKLWNLALEGITSFSTAPLRIWLYLGLVFSFLSFIYGCMIIGRTILLGIDVPGYASLLTVVLFLGGIQLLGIGILGEYLGRTYHEAKRRPVYVIENEY